MGTRWEVARVELLWERADDLLDQDHGSGHLASVTASWVVGFDRLADDSPAALDLLTVVAWCAPDPVPLTLLTEHPKVFPERLRRTCADPLALIRCTQLLHRRGLATVAPHTLNCRICAGIVHNRRGVSAVGVGCARGSVVNACSSAVSSAPGSVTDTVVTPLLCSRARNATCRGPCSKSRNISAGPCAFGSSRNTSRGIPRNSAASYSSSV
jgi:hypothetical protein